MKFNTMIVMKDINRLKHLHPKSPPKIRYLNFTSPQGSVSEIAVMLEVNDKKWVRKKI